MLLWMLLGGLVVLLSVRILMVRPRRHVEVLATTFGQDGSLGADGRGRYDQGTYYLNPQECLTQLQIESMLQGSRAYEPLILVKGKSCCMVITHPVGLSHMGDMACRIARETIFGLYQGDDETSPKDFLEQACFLAHRNINEQMYVSNSGCSVAVLHIERGKLHWASSGDVGIYLCTHEMRSLNRMDLYKHRLRERVLEKKLKEEAVVNNRLKNELTAYLGHENLRQVELSDMPVMLRPSDQLLVVSKEVYEAFSPLRMEGILRSILKPKEKMMALESAFACGSQGEERRGYRPVAVIACKFR